MVAGGTYAYGSYPDIDGLFREQAAELDREAARGDAAQDPAARARQGDVRADLRARRFINGFGPRVEESGLGLIAGYAFSRAVRGPQAQGPVTMSDRAPMEVDVR